MQTAILCGGPGLRAGDPCRPLEMVEVGGYPLVWHVMKQYAHHGFRDFVLCLGYGGGMVRDFFLNYVWRTNDFRLDLRSGRVALLGEEVEADWRLTFVDTGGDTRTGGRLLRAARHIAGERFFVARADVLSDIDPGALLAFHLACGATATATGVRPRSALGRIEAEGPWVTRLRDRPAPRRLASGGHFVFERSVLGHLGGDDTTLEEEPLRRLAAERRLAVYEHRGFWEVVDAQRGVARLDRLWRGACPWRVWES